MIWHQVKIKAFHAYNKERNLLHFVKFIMPISYVIRVFLSVCEWTSGEFINLFVKNYHAIAWFYERYKIKHSRQITFQNNFCESNLDSIFTNLFLRVLKTNVIDKIIIFVPCENISLWKKNKYEITTRANIICINGTKILLEQLSWIKQIFRSIPDQTCYNRSNLIQFN